MDLEFIIQLEDKSGVLNLMGNVFMKNVMMCFIKSKKFLEENKLRENMIFYC